MVGERAVRVQSPTLSHSSALHEATPVAEVQEVDHPVIVVLVVVGPLRRFPPSERTDVRHIWPRRLAA
jgi:hypothetical protein